MSKATTKQTLKPPYGIEIRVHNLQVHKDIEIDLCKIKKGVMTFTLRVNDGNIMDYLVLEHYGY